MKTLQNCYSACNHDLSLTYVRFCCFLQDLCYIFMWRVRELWPNALKPSVHVAHHQSFSLLSFRNCSFKLYFYDLRKATKYFFFCIQCRSIIETCIHCSSSKNCCLWSREMKYDKYNEQLIVSYSLTNTNKKRIIHKRTLKFLGNAAWNKIFMRHWNVCRIFRAHRHFLVFVR